MSTRPKFKYNDDFFRIELVDPGDGEWCSVNQRGELVEPKDEKFACLSELFSGWGGEQVLTFSMGSTQSGNVSIGVIYNCVDSDVKVASKVITGGLREGRLLFAEEGEVTKAINKLVKKVLGRS